jgi:hypothetical protein
MVPIPSMKTIDGAVVRASANSSRTHRRRHDQQIGEKTVVLDGRFGGDGDVVLRQGGPEPVGGEGRPLRLELRVRDRRLVGLVQEGRHEAGDEVHDEHGQDQPPPAAPHPRASTGRLLRLLRGALGTPGAPPWQGGAPGVVRKRAVSP